MYDYKKIMIALDLSDIDQSLIVYSAGLCELIRPDKIYFINIQSNLDLDEEVKELLGNQGLPMDEFCEQQMRASVQKHFPDIDSYDTEYEVVEGNPSVEILRWTKMKDTDLLIMGRKKVTKGSGITPQQVSAKVKASVLVIPEGTQRFQLNRLFLPIDFSSYSSMMLEEAFFIQEKAPWSISISCTHMYELPLGFEKSGKSEKEFATIIEQNAKKRADELKASFKGKADKLEIVYTLSDKRSFAKILNQQAHDAAADLIIVGAKGRTFASSLFLGSISAKLIKEDSDIPLLVIKDKKEPFDFWAFIKAQ